MKLPMHRRANSFDLQMTAMIDVVFLLLVFFLWTSSFDKPEFDLASSLALPPVGNQSFVAEKSPVPFDEIVIRIVQSPNGIAEIRFNSVVMETIAELKTKLATVAEIGAQPAVIVDPDSDVTMETSIEVYDVARSAGFDRVLFTVAP